MKYTLSNETIPHDARKDINTKIEYIVNNDLPEEQTGISRADIFNAYTGIGGLHGLDFKDYGNYYDYRKAKEEIEQGQFFTPYKLVEWIYDCLHISAHDLVADLTCGHGAFASCLPTESNFYGCELEARSCNVASYLYPDAHIQNTDIRFYDPGVTFDYVLGNPPYNLSFRDNGASYLSEFYYCMKAARLLKPAGIMAIIVPMAFCADDFSDGSMIDEMNSMFNFICQVELDKDTFSHLGVKNYRTKIVFFQKKSQYLDDVSYNTEVLNSVSSSDIWETYMQPITEKREKIKQKVFLEIVHNSGESHEWTYKVEKILYDIKRNPNVNSEYAMACEYLNKYKT
ncbi:MAG: N-6 DNA methylase, partial [Lachnospiraceae bacterium]|nr:N-6 DNA methylase [Lachnospiraceae bacterium]